MNLQNVNEEMIDVVEEETTAEEEMIVEEEMIDVDLEIAMTETIAMTEITEGTTEVAKIVLLDRLKMEEIQTDR